MWRIKEIDLKNPKTNRKNAGFTDEERRAKFTELLEAGLCRYVPVFLSGSERASIPGGLTGFRRGRRTPAGVSTIFCVSDGSERPD